MLRSRKKTIIMEILIRKQFHCRYFVFTSTF